MTNKTHEDLLKWRKKQKRTKQTDGRCSAYMSQIEAADYFGVVLNTYVNWEKGHTAFPHAVGMLI